MKLRIRLENYKGVFARMWFNIAMTRDRLSFASVEIDKSYSFTLPPWKNLFHRWSRDQPRPGAGEIENNGRFGKKAEENLGKRVFTS